MSIADPVIGGPEVESPRDAIPIFEEKAVVEKEKVTTGRVRVTTQTRLVDDIASAILESQHLDVTRVSVGTPVSGDLPGIRTEGDTTIVPVFEEVLFVEKRLMLKEEVRIRRRSSEETVELPVQLRKQEVLVDRQGE